MNNLVIIILIYLALTNFALSEIFSKNVKIVNQYKVIGQKNFISGYKTFLSEDMINVVIEIPKSTNEKWEVSKIDGSLEHDFFMGKPRIIEYGPYPFNYGMIPQTVLPLSVGGDGDPLDVIVIGDKILRGSIIEAKVLGMIDILDMGELDTKVIAIPKNFSNGSIKDLEDLKLKKPEILEEILGWFLNYKGKNLITFKGYGPKTEILEKIKQASKYYKRYGVKPR